ncbi:zinc-dependent alcohol dehydrogenase family protein [Gracilibacillus phocaeensis]|uniref:zinc-dependent alcohol dehydrogenase family protein n=1 Tax=Gracilibacillus phocaeensis TaxID=2042304 RepID=UPI0010319FD8|nr:zinc-dependent alcohol dehydrogenase family protein [Gracilibacillus phocaeensis]
MKAVSFQEPQSISVIETPYPSPEKEEVTIKVECCGICGTDYHIFTGDYISNYPIIGGHEFSGRVYEIGEDVKNWNVGDRVTVDPAIYCRKCYYCRNKKFNQCKNVKGIGVAMDGAFAEYVKVPAINLYRIPEQVTFEAASLMEPLACVIYAVERVQPKLGDKALIFGAGPMGLLVLQALKISGVSEIVVVDVETEKLAFANKIGASKVCTNDHDLNHKLSEKYFPNLFDIVVDATGVKDVMQEMFHYAGSGARILQFGVPSVHEKIEINPFDLYHNDWSYIGTMAASFTCEQALMLIQHSKIDVSKLITKKLTLEEFTFYMTDRKPKQDIKVLVSPS